MLLLLFTLSIADFAAPNSIVVKMIRGTFAFNEDSPKNILVTNTNIFSFTSKHRVFFSTNVWCNGSINTEFVLQLLLIEPVTLVQTRAHSQKPIYAAN